MSVLYKDLKASVTLGHEFVSKSPWAMNEVPKLPAKKEQKCKVRAESKFWVRHTEKSVVLFCR